MSLPFDPACAPLLLGSLPYRSAVQALDVSRRYAGELLAWPQLWLRGFREQFLVQGAVGLPGLTFDEPRQQVVVVSSLAQENLEQLALAYLENRTSFAQLSDREAAGLFELLRMGEPPASVRAVKGQVLGPISLAMQLTDERERPLIYDPAMFEAIGHFVRLRVAWQEQRLAELRRPTIICLDEPFLEMIGSPFLPVDWAEVEAQINLVLEDVRGCRAIFVGGAIDWGHLLRLHVDLVIGDVYEHSGLMLGAAESLATFVQDGGLVGLGIVPADAEELARETAESLVQKLGRLCEELERAGVDVGRMLRQAVLTPNGALGSLDMEAAERALRLLADTSQLMRERYGLTGGEQAP